MSRGIRAAVALLLVFTACRGGTSEADPPSTAAIYAAAARHLATEHNTFGPGHHFSELLVVDHTVQDLVATFGTGRPGPAFTEAETDAIEAALAPLSPVRFVASEADWRTEDFTPVIAGSAIITLGPAELRSDGSAAVAVGLWCGWLCGFWTVFVLENVDGTWAVTGTEGPSVIS